MQRLSNAKHNAECVLTFTHYLAYLAALLFTLTLDTHAMQVAIEELPDVERAYVTVMQ